MLPALSTTRRWIANTAVLLLWPAVALAQEQKKQPPPEFTSGYQLPTVATPGPRLGFFSYIDVLVLVGVMALAAYFVLARRSRREIPILLVFSLAYFGFLRYGCVCAVGSIQNVALAVGDNGYALPFTVGAFFVLPLLAALFFGRVFCGAACPLGAIQEVVLHRPRRVPASLDHALGILPYVYLGAAVMLAATGTTFLVCRYDPFVAFFRLGGTAGMLTFGVAMLALSTVVARPFCRYLCPYGVLLRWASQFARWRVHVAPSACVQCHLCADACPFGALRPPTPADAGEPRRAARRRLGRALALLPAVVALGGWLGWLSGPVVSRLHPTVALAERVWAEEHGSAKGVTDASAAFRTLGRPTAVLYAEAAGIRRTLMWGCAALGAWIGLVVAAKLVYLSIPQRRGDYDADPAACLSCGRCYSSCPVGRPEPLPAFADAAQSEL